MIRTKGEPGTGNVVEAVRHVRKVNEEVRRGCSLADLDCQDIPHRRFRVLPPDPHRFDTDRDGVGCEGSATGAGGSAVPASRRR